MDVGQIHRDSATANMSAGSAGVLLGFRMPDDLNARPTLSMVELQTGVVGRLHPLNPVVHNAGLELAAGWGNLERDLTGTLGLRLPLEHVYRSERLRVSLSAVPTMAWGHIRFRGCENLRSGDNCGDLGIQLEFGRTRFLMAGGVGIGLEPAGITLSVGMQRLMAAGQDPRMVAGLAWSL